MSIRWRKDGSLICAARSAAEEGDTYIDDRLHYQLSVLSKAILPDVDEGKTGRWWWLADVWKGSG